MKRLSRTKRQLAPATMNVGLSREDVKLLIRSVKESVASTDHTEPAIMLQRSFGVHPSGFRGLVETWDEHPAHAMERMLKGEL